MANGTLPASVREERDRAEAAMVARMESGEPFTFGDLAEVARNAVGTPDGRSGGVAGSRLADAIIQRRRKAGEIQFERVGRDVSWSMANVAPGPGRP